MDNHIKYEIVYNLTYGMIHNLYSFYPIFFSGLHGLGRS